MNENLNHYMTSELLYLFMKNRKTEFGTKIYKQLLNRLYYCDCTDNVIESFLEREVMILNHSKYTKIPSLNYPIEEGMCGICGFDWWKDYKPIYDGNLNNVHSMDFTISEIISITDRAEYLVVYENENENISDSLFSEIYAFSEKGQQKILLNQLADELLYRGWSYENLNTFFMNEFSIIMKYQYNEIRKPFGEED